VAEEERQLTLDEWKALQQRDRAKPASFNIRKPGEGVQTAPEWKKMYVLKKKVADDNEDEDEYEYEEVRQLNGIQIIELLLKLKFYYADFVTCHWQGRGKVLDKSRLSPSLITR